MEENKTNDVYSLKEFALLNGCNGHMTVRIRETEDENTGIGRTFFVLSFEQPGQTITNSRGEEVQKHFDIAFGRNTQKLNNLEPSKMTDRQVMGWVKEHLTELKAGWTQKRDSQDFNKIPSCWLPSAETELW